MEGDDSTPATEGETEKDQQSNGVPLEFALERVLATLEMDADERAKEAAVDINTDCANCREDLQSQRLAVIEALAAANGQVLVEFVLAMLDGGAVVIEQ